MQDKDIIFGSVAWQIRFNKGKWARYCTRECTHVDKPTTFDHQTAFRKFCRKQGMASATCNYQQIKGGDYHKVEHHYIQSDEPEVDNKTFKLKPLTQPERVKRAA